MNKLQQVNRKLLLEDTLAEQISTWKTNDQKIVFTNGCFDILHKGHVTYLAKAAELGDQLIIGLNSDQSVRRLEKGDDRPINAENDRAFLLAALGFVDAVIIFDNDTPYELISKIIPDVLVKGGDYDPNEKDKTHPKYIVGSDIVTQNGGAVEVISFVDGYSTTSIIEKMKP